jgi:hypothetical protein
MGEDILRRPIEAIADQAWHGTYLVTPDQQNLIGGCFDFGGQLLSSALQGHSQLLNRLRHD